MEITIKIQGAEYPFPGFDTLSYEEAATIKKQTGLRMGEFFGALEAGDTDAILAVAVIALTRENGEADVSKLRKLKLNDIEIVVSETEDDAEDADPKDEAVAVDEVAPTPSGDTSTEN